MEARDRADKRQAAEHLVLLHLAHADYLLALELTGPPNMNLRMK